jgi:RNA polymerase primary sigma factor
MINTFAPHKTRRNTLKVTDGRRSKATTSRTIPSQEQPTASVQPQVAPPVVTRPSERLPYDGNTALRLYMREAGLVPLLTPDEEVKLASRIRQGDKAARERMILSNLRLVVKIAREYEDFGLPLLDLINEGNMGLMKAVEKFDPRKGGKLSTYGAWWIRQSIRRGLANQAKTIRLPVHVVVQIFHLRRAEMRLQDVFGRPATDLELAQELKLSPVRVRELRAAGIRPASLDAPLGSDDDNSRLADIIEDENAHSPSADLEEKGQLNLLQELLPKLQPREAAILRFRFGLDGGPEKTLEEVGQKFGVTRERIRQLQNSALVKLRRMMEEQENIAQAA